uniref:DUF3627 domain-containing protein n=1 Tax=viral metagenome TaxID=1070528 RepID=A0A6C0H7N4_9ZZZZ
MANILIEKFNNQLLEEQITINIIDYVKEVNNLYYKIDISFIDEFINLVSKDECCIYHDKLQKYGILKIYNGTTNIKRLLIDQNLFQENIDFRVNNIVESAPKGGCTHKNEYYLHPRAFKICLMRSLKTKKYAKYYLLLEECIKYFNEYQNKLKEKYNIDLKLKIENKNNKICQLEQKIDKLLEDNKITHKHNEEMKKYNEEMKIINNELIKRSHKLELQLNDTLEKLDETHNILGETKDELEITNEKLDTTDKTLNIVANKLNIAVKDRVIHTKKKSTIEFFVIMKNLNAEYKYYIIRGQHLYITSKKEQLNEFVEIKKLECVPNATILWNLIKEQLKNSIDYCGNKLNLININESEFLEKIEIIYDSRKEVNL